MRKTKRALALNATVTLLTRSLFANALILIKVQVDIEKKEREKEMKKNQANHQANVFIRRCANEHRSMSIVLAG